MRVGGRRATVMPQGADKPEHLDVLQFAVDCMAQMQNRVLRGFFISGGIMKNITAAGILFWTLAFNFQFSAFNCFAESIDLGEIVISGSYTQMQQKQTCSDIEILYGEKLARKGVSTVKDALETVQGADISTTGINGQTSVFLRGMDQKYTLVLIDGVKVYDPSSADAGYDLNGLSLEGIEKIEVIKGAQGSIYGSGAAGGVINIITKKGTGRPEFYIASEAGSHDTFRESMGHSGQLGKLSYSLNLSRYDTDGLSAALKTTENNVYERDGYGGTSATSRFDYKLSDDIDLSLSGRYKTERYAYDDGAEDEDPNTRRNGRTGVLGFGYDHRLTEVWTQNVKLSYMTYSREYFDGPDEIDITDSYNNSTYKGANRSFDWNHEFKFTHEYTLNLGYQYNREQYAQRGTWGTVMKKTAFNNGYYFENKFKLLDERLFSNFSFRTDDHSRFGSHRTFKLDSSYLLTDTTRLKADYATGFKAPSLFHLYSSYGNINLRPEKVKSFEFGVEQDIPGADVTTGITYFHNDITDKIEYSSGTYSNLPGLTKTKGIETFLRYSPDERFKLSLDYTYLDAFNHGDNAPLIRRARNKYGLSVSYDITDKLNVDFDVSRFIGRYGQVGWGTNKAYPNLKPYTKADIGVNYEVTENFSIYARIVNLFDEKYVHALGFTTEPRSFYAGAKLRF